jgi:hypothetical protein
MAHTKPINIVIDPQFCGQQQGVIPAAAIFFYYIFLILKSGV